MISGLDHHPVGAPETSIETTGDETTDQEHPGELVKEKKPEGQLLKTEIGEIVQNGGAEWDVDRTLWLYNTTPGLEKSPNLEDFISMLSQEYRRAALEILFETASGIKCAVLSKEAINNVLSMDLEFCEKNDIEPLSSPSKLEVYSYLLDKEGADSLKILGKNGKIECIFVDQEAFNKFCKENDCNTPTEGRYLFLKSIGIDGVDLSYSELKLIISDSPTIHMPFK